MKDKSIEVDEQTIGVSLEAGARIKLYEDERLFFFGKVERYVPESGLLSFSGGTEGLYDFKEKMKRADRIEISYR